MLCVALHLPEQPHSGRQAGRQATALTGTERRVALIACLPLLPLYIIFAVLQATLCPSLQPMAP